MERFEKLELIQRSLGIRHKLKVHESMKAPETHDELAIMLLAKWELEDELRAIEEVLTQSRLENVVLKRKQVEKDYSVGSGAAKERAAKAKAKK
ncbi:MAG: hypothetical protein P4M08_03430 [Oligoflexia bacterium]|nr:hypothetical protein [Oligoflexia bacterium]